MTKSEPNWHRYESRIVGCINMSDTVAILVESILILQCIVITVEHCHLISTLLVHSFIGIIVSKKTRCCSNNALL